VDPNSGGCLASLLLHPNKVVPAEHLIDQVWGEEPPNTARKNLQGYVTHLRQALGPDRLEWRAPRAAPHRVELSELAGSGHHRTSLCP
jgi:DNA-binding SARP family transcriptional activator